LAQKARADKKKNDGGGNQTPRTTPRNQTQNATQPQNDRRRNTQPSGGGNNDQTQEVRGKDSRGKSVPFKYSMPTQNETHSNRVIDGVPHTYNWVTSKWVRQDTPNAFWTHGKINTNPIPHHIARTMTNAQRVTHANQVQQVFNSQLGAPQANAAQAPAFPSAQAPRPAPAVRFATVPGYGQIPIPPGSIAAGAAAAAATISGQPARPTEEELEDIAAANAYLQQMQSRYGGNHF
jgi:hypothetical protein